MKKKITGVTIIQVDGNEFTNEKGEKITYTEYFAVIDNRELKIKAGNATTKVRLSDAFEKAVEVK